MKLTAIVLTRNNEASIKTTLESLEFADEIIVIDDFSTDSTVSKIKNYPKVVVFQRQLENDFSRQRNFGLEKASGDWILFVDSDESVPKELAREITSVLYSSNPANGYYLKRRDYFLGKKLHYGETGSIKLLRLAKNGSGIWEKSVHEIWNINGEIGELQNPLDHKHTLSVSDYLEKIDTYSSIYARELYEKKCQESLWKIVLNPTGKFILNYFFKLGFLDGFAGFAVAWLMSWHSLLVRVKLQLLWHSRGENYFSLKK